MAKHHAYPEQNYRVDSEGHRIHDGQELLDDEYIACPYCFEHSSSLGDIDYCGDCETIIEGATIIYTYTEADEPHKRYEAARLAANT